VKTVFSSVSPQQIAKMLINVVCDGGWLSQLRKRLRATVNWHCGF